MFSYQNNKVIPQKWTSHKRLHENDLIYSIQIEWVTLPNPLKLLFSYLKIY